MTSEAGVIAYYSGWETFDTVGLNTPKVALGRVQPEDVNLFAPDLIVLARSDTASTDERSAAMMRNVVSGVSAGDYEHYRLAQLYPLPPLADALNLHRVYKTLGSPLVGEFWLKRNSPAYTDLRRILEANGAVRFTASIP